MSVEKKNNPPPYFIPVEGRTNDVKVYHVHTPFTPPVIGDTQVNAAEPPQPDKPVYVERSTILGFDSGKTVCPTCKTDVMTNVTYKAGTYAWLMCLLFICLGLVLCCCLIPFFMNRFKDAYHTCPRCSRVLHVEKRQCCK